MTTWKPQLTHDVRVNLSRGQLDCLRLVLEHRNSKEIARELGISRHTVDARLKAAMRALGAQTRVQAAQMAIPNLHQISAYQPLDIDHQRPGHATDCLAGFDLPTAHHSQLTLVTDGKADDGKALAAANAVNHQWKDFWTEAWKNPGMLGAFDKLLVVVVIAAVTAIAAGALISAIEGLSVMRH